ncbi:hypothetical protein D3C78_710880 [compost metagenome]
MRAKSNGSGLSGGSALLNGCTRATPANTPGNAQTSRLAHSSPSISAGQRGRRQRTSRLTPRLVSPTSNDGASNSASRCSSAQALSSVVLCPPDSMPSRYGI